MVRKDLQSKGIPAEERLAAFTAHRPKVVSEGGSSTDLTNLLRFSSFRFNTFPWHPFSFLLHYMNEIQTRHKNTVLSNFGFSSVQQKNQIISVLDCLSFVSSSLQTSALDDHRDIKVHSPYLDLLRIVATPVQAQSPQGCLHFPHLQIQPFAHFQMLFFLKTTVVSIQTLAYIGLEKRMLPDLVVFLVVTR